MGRSFVRVQKLKSLSYTVCMRETLDEKHCILQICKFYGIESIVRDLCGFNLDEH